MKWNYLANLESPVGDAGKIQKILLKNRGLTSKSEIDQFLNPPDPLTVSSKQVGIDPKAVKTAIKRIKKAVEDKETIVIYGDYDADGISSTAILWEALHYIGAKAIPFIPHRQKHGYGISTAGVDEIIADHDPDLIITVDNGIVANKATEYIQSKDIDLIITDHHQVGEELPKALAIVHSDQIAGSGVAWFFAKDVVSEFTSPEQAQLELENSLDLLAIGTVADLMPMRDFNRSIVKFGLPQLQKTHRVGLKELFNIAGIKGQDFTTYHIGFVIGPRINAMGRMDHGLDALRLMCAKDRARAQKLANHLNETNKFRQDVTADLVELADKIYQDTPELVESNIIIISHDDFHEGIIGLIAGRLTEKYSKPTIVITSSDGVSKASARSVSGINIIELIRGHQDLLVNAGGHPGAAGFSIETAQIEPFSSAIIETANQTIDQSLLTKTLDIDLNLDPNIIDQKLYDQITKLAPFGMQNPKPVFSSQVVVETVRSVGRDNSHLKLTIVPVKNSKLQNSLHAIGFRLGEYASQITPGQKLEIAYQVTENTWNNRTTIQLQLKDVKP